MNGINITPEAFRAAAAHEIGLLSAQAIERALLLQVAATEIARLTDANANLTLRLQRLEQDIEVARKAQTKAGLRKRG